MAKDKKSILQWVNELVDLMDARSLGELEIDLGSERVKLSRSSGVMQTIAPVAAQSAASQPAVAAEGGADTAADAHPGAVKSPIVGTAYLSPQPGAKPFAAVGDKVSQGQTLLIVEAMKVMNPIQAPSGGTLTQMLIKDGEPVEYGQILAVIE